MMLILISIVFDDLSISLFQPIIVLKIRFLLYFFILCDAPLKFNLEL